MNICSNNIFTITKRGISDEQIAVVVTCDRSDNKELRVTTRGRISKKDLVTVHK